MMTPEQIEFHRKRFEEYYRNLPSYKESENAAMFQGYLMAIESIEIELPERTYIVDGLQDRTISLRESVNNIKSLGLKVKEW